MSDDEGGDVLEAVKARHRRELKDLQARIQAMKKAVARGDTKSKKAVQAEIERLEESTRTAQQAEIKALQEAAPKPPADNVLLLFLFSPF